MTNHKMTPKYLNLLLRTGIIGMLLIATPAGFAIETAFWYEDNNMRKAGGYPDDFKEMFENPASWEQMRRKLSVYCIRGNTLKNVINDLGEEWVIQYFCGLLKKENIPVAIDNPSLDRIPSIKLLEQNGLVISHLALQSVLSKFKARSMTPEQRIQEIRKRIETTVPKLVWLRKTFPQSKIGIIDALPPKGVSYADPYADLLAKSRSAGAPIQFIHVDAPYSAIEKTLGWKKLHQLKKTISRDLDLEFGIIVTDNIGGMESNKAFYNQVMRMSRKYPEAAYPDYFILMSWYHHPKYAVRQADPQGEYTMTRTALDFFTFTSNRAKKSQMPKSTLNKTHSGDLKCPKPPSN